MKPNYEQMRSRQRNEIYEKETKLPCKEIRPLQDTKKTSQLL